MRCSLPLQPSGAAPEPPPVAKGERGTEAREFSRAVADIFLAKPIAALRDLAPAIGSYGKGTARDVPHRGYRFIPIPLVLVEVQTQFRFE